MENVFISVIIVTRNREIELKRTIEKFLEQKFEFKEIIVVDNNSENIDWENFKKLFPQVEFILLPTNISMNAFDIGLSKSKGNVIWRTDDDSNPRDNFAFNLVNDIFLKNPSIDIIATEILEPLYNDNLVDWYPIKVDKTNIPSFGYSSNTFLGGGVAIKKKVFDKIGTFWGFGYEELDFSTRAILSGFNISYYPNIITDHYCSKNNRNRINRLILMALQQVKYHAKYFNFFKSLSRFIVLLFFQNFEALTITRNPKVFCELNFGMIYTYVSTRNNLRVKVPREMMDKVTLKENLFLGVIRYFKIRAKRFFGKRKNAT